MGKLRPRDRKKLTRDLPSEFMQEVTSLRPSRPASDEKAGLLEEVASKLWHERVSLYKSPKTQAIFPIQLHELGLCQSDSVEWDSLLQDGFMEHKPPRTRKPAFQFPFHIPKGVRRLGRSPSCEVRNPEFKSPLSYLGPMSSFWTSCSSIVITLASWFWDLVG